MFDFPKYANDHSVETQLKGHHSHKGWVQSHCMMCSDGHHGFHLGWSIKSGFMSCWRCGAVRTMDYLTGRHSLADAKRLRREYETTEGYREERVKPDVIRKQIAAIRRRGIPTPKGLVEMGKAHKRYLRNRGFKNVNRLIAEWEMKCTTFIGPALWRWRVVAPIKDIDGDIVSYVGRSLDPDSDHKYCYTDAEDMRIPSSELLYGIHNVPNETIIIVEGPADVWRLGPGGVAVNGVSWSPEQVALLRQFDRRFVMFDPEPKAQVRAMKLAEELSIFPGSTEVISGLKTDPGDLSLRAVRKIRKYLAV